MSGYINIGASRNGHLKLRDDTHVLLLGRINAHESFISIDHDAACPHPEYVSMPLDVRALRALANQANDLANIIENNAKNLAAREKATA